MKQAINSFISRHELINAGDHLLLAVSGGPDSMAMLHFFHKMKEDIPLIISVAHVDHGLRGEYSKKDAELVSSYCGRLNVPYYLYEADVKALKEKEGLSTQEAARTCRYKWFAGLMEKLGADKLVTAHHGDDQVETMLMRQIRGSLSGRKGIPVKRPFAEGWLVRPFLAVEKSDLEAYCERHGIPYNEDASNQTDLYLRNRIRNHVLSFVKEENPKVHEAFQWQSEVWAEEEMWLQSEAERFASGIITRREENETVISLPELKKIPNALQRRVIHLILNYLSIKNQLQIDRSHIESVIGLLKNSHPSALLHLPNHTVVEKSYDHLIFMINDSADFHRIDHFEPQELAIPGETELPLGKLLITPDSPQADKNASEDSVWFDMDKLTLPLIVRARLPGDRMSFFGSSGTKKLKDLFMEEKVPKRDRDLWPVVTDRQGKIVWVPLLKRSNEAVVDSESGRVIKLTYQIYT
ncbi:tRNA lysidine(34) synthetase TilS [Salipaludibacillus sp. CUR1]|uniref:tRNA lysidine(34) synthetase TilS n=1 Tax=Salipaludibacillus sp. CUR1 TaxID=2820003 RepID=UPI001E426B2A|nr:tRNA lysidine(34) synthetase TilS [Salipaludibacillus sp. CUR1]MCE7791271.1 tRNA lysidine(34) synthetase TilS [Salipaludibacillus sp. CUR1]